MIIIWCVTMVDGPCHSPPRPSSACLGTISANMYNLSYRMQYIHGVRDTASAYVLQTRRVDAISRLPPYDPEAAAGEENNASSSGLLNLALTLLAHSSSSFVRPSQ